MRCPSLIYTSSSIPIIHILWSLCKCGDSLRNLASVNQKRSTPRPDPSEAQIINAPGGSCIFVKWRNQKWSFNLVETAKVAEHSRKTPKCRPPRRWGGEFWISPFHLAVSGVWCALRRFPTLRVITRHLRTACGCKVKDARAIILEMRWLAAPNSPRHTQRPQIIDHN